jgi:plastocyanin
MRISTCGFLVCASVALGMLAGSIAPRAVAARELPATHTVTIESMLFKPDDLTVAPGDSVVWVNHDLFPHSVTASGGAFDSKEIPAGESWTYTASKEGEFAYTCTLHPTMKGILRVK